MKKFFLSIVAALLAVPTFAQFTSGGFTLSESNVYYGVRLGASIASLSGDDVDMDAKTGLTLAGVVGLRLSDGVPVFLESGLYYTERGAKKDKQSVGYNNLEIPVLVKYGFQATDEIAVLPFLGPVFSYAFSGKTKQYQANTTTGDIELVKVGTFDEKKAITGGLKRPNMGIKVGCGAEWNNLYLEAGYHFGLTNIAKDDDFTIHSNALFVNFGVNF